jgi:nicotinamidase/pyrazinamidase
LVFGRSLAYRLPSPVRYIVAMEARPEALYRSARYDAPSAARYDARSALIVVDMQNDFADPRGSLYVRGGDQIVPDINRAIMVALEAGALVVYTQDWHPPVTPHFRKDGGIWPVHCVRDTWGAQFHPALNVSGPVIRKGTGGEDGYSGFSVRNPATGAESSTGLETLLRSRGVERVVVVGLATDYCVKETALDAVRLGFKTMVFEDLVRAVNLNASDGEHALAQMVSAGVDIGTSFEAPRPSEHSLGL